LWREVDAANWVSPQCAVALYLLDSGFEASCAQRLRGAHPSFRAEPKNVSVLVALWHRLPGKAGDVNAAIDSGKLAAPVDGGEGDLALKWLAWVSKSFDEPDVRARWARSI
jgi:hypothetical protein